ncbi:MAG: metal-dependent transcriptional regulator [Tissierellia bacterium]|nr:metal-dependent transcriptional regulator [Tissierellia bacterium]
MRVTESEENYLESILMIGEKKNKVKAVDIARKLDFSKPSVSYAMKNLQEKGLIEIKDNYDIVLTDAGRSIAAEIYERHTVVAKVLISLGINEETAYQDSCAVEHRISQETFDKIKQFAKDNKII